MTDRIRVALIGIGGYGEVYLSSLLDEPEGARCEIVGVVDPHPEGCSRLPELVARGTPVYDVPTSLFANQAVDLTVISSPIQLHADHTCEALERGSNVLLEKPAAAVPAEVDRMLHASEGTGRFVAVGYQWSFSTSILDLKRDILAGHFGAPQAGRSLTLWPRTEGYYLRNDWAGRRKDPHGRWILDSPANNAMAHFLHNLLFLMGPKMALSEEPEIVTARLGRVNDIETFDTVAARIQTRGGADLRFFASHAISESEAADPSFTLEFEGGTIVFPGGSPAPGADGKDSLPPITAQLADGTVRRYPSPDETPQVEKLWTCVSAIRGDAVIPCTLETALPHARCIEAIEESGTVPVSFPEERLRTSRTDGGALRWVEGLAASLAEAYAVDDWPDLLGGPP
ncbi:MAG: Gfo/Idh/MocA family oxidoreductase [Gemmatimonadota bacterium]|jgi:predicted dehydrogenase